MSPGWGWQRVGEMLRPNIHGELSRRACKSKIRRWKIYSLRGCRFKIVRSEQVMSATRGNLKLRRLQMADLHRIRKVTRLPLTGAKAKAPLYPLQVGMPALDSIPDDSVAFKPKGARSTYRVLRT